MSTVSLQAHQAELAEHVTVGAALLDQRHPGWERQIDVDLLDMASAEDDMLGQLYGSYDEGLDALIRRDPDPSAWAPHAFAVAYGFDATADEPGVYDDRTQAWRVQVAQRRIRKLGQGERTR